MSRYACSFISCQGSSSAISGPLIAEIQCPSIVTILEYLHFYVNRWHHECPLATLTLADLLNNHGDVLHTLEFRQYTQRWKKTDLAALAMTNLRTLKIAALDVWGRKWPIYLLAKNSKNLRALKLSNETAMALRYKHRRARDPHGTLRRSATERLVESLRTEHDALPGWTVPTLRLDSLSLCGFDVSVIVQELPAPLVDFNNLSSLVIQSCSGLNEALRMLMGTNTARRKTMGALQLRTLIIRHEDVDDAFMPIPKAFLMSLCPLTTLHVLLEGRSDIEILEESLEPHGKSLESLVWDERYVPRSHIQVDTCWAEKLTLRHIAKHCIKLKALGIPLCWQELTESDSAHLRVSHPISPALDEAAYTHP